MRNSQTIHPEPVHHPLVELAKTIKEAAREIEYAHARACDAALVSQITAVPALDPATSEVLQQLTTGEISLIGATHKLGLPDAGYVLSLMREHGVRPYRHSNAAALESAKQAVRAARSSKPAKLAESLTARS